MTARLRSLILVFACFVTVGARPAAAQQAPPAAQEARLLVTVVDPSAGVLPTATVSLTGLEDATKKAAVAPLKTSEKGLAIFDKLVPGRYTLIAEFPGFETRSMEVRVRAGGDNKQVMVLPLKRMEDAVTVSRDRQEAAADRAPLFGTALTREQIELLSDDPDEMRRQLTEMAGPDAVFKVDSFEGRDLPPKAQIKSVRISRDQFAAESHYAGGLFIEIVTQPGLGPMRANTRFGFRDSSMDGKNSMTTSKPDSQNRNLGFNLGGTLVPEKASFSINISGTNSYTQPNFKAALPNGSTNSDVARFRTPRDSTFASGYLDWAVTKDQTIRMSFGGNRSKARNLGVGAYDLSTRAYGNESNGYNFMLQEVGPLGRRFFINTRFFGNYSKSSTESTVEAMTIRVQDAFTTGGAQQTGDRRAFNYSLASDLDYVRGIHSWRAGVNIDGYSYRSDESQNYLGTYTFSSLTTFELGRPRSFTRRIGDPLIDYTSVQAGFYLQDDIRLRRNLTLTPGVRYEVQNHLDDYNNIMPRVGLTWSPNKSGATTLRVSYGIFYDWISTNVYEQTLRVDGFRQQELNIIDPSYPDPGDAGVAPATNRYLYSDNVLMATTKRLSAGINQRINARMSFGVSYADSRAADRARGHNLNAPAAGVRPDPQFANVVEVISDGSMWSRSLNTNFSFNFAAPSPALQQARFNWRRMSVFGNFGIGKSRNNSDGAFTIPASNGVEAEWGPSGEDVRYRFNASLNSNALRNFNAGLSFNTYSAAPYNVTTGIDVNGDTIFNDRPFGIERNSARGSAGFNTSANFSYTWSFGSRKVALPPGISITSVGGAMTVSTGQASQASRYRIGFNVSIFNLTNRQNLVGYSGVMTSQFFGQPTAVSGTRQVNFGVNFSF